MARPKEFNRDEALTKAVEVFWAKGFEATTMTDLRKAMGIGRQSLYDTFGDKNELFAEVLQRYGKMNQGFLAAVLDGRGLDGVRDYLSSTVQALAYKPECRGCLTMNTCVDRAPHDPAVAELTQRNLADVRAALEGALGRAVERGEVSADLDVAQSAAFLTNQVAGMAVLGKSGATADDLTSTVTMALNALV